MSGDLAQVANDVAPYVTAAVSAYGASVLARAQEEAATATVGVGRRLVQRIFGTRQEGEQVPEVLADVITDPQDADNLGALRKAIRKALASDEELAEQVRAILTEVRDAGVRVSTSGDRSPAVHANEGIIVTGDHTTIQR
jgi:hypothetical protein